MGLGAQARSGSYPRRGTRMQKAGNRVQLGRRSRSLCNNFIGNQSGKAATAARRRTEEQRVAERQEEEIKTRPGRENRTSCFAFDLGWSEDSGTLSFS